jgi:GNAT superfamily N-acetyltransferase
MTVTIELVHTLTANDFADLVLESERFEFRFVRRLVDDWAKNVNRFDGPGEALFVAKVCGKIVGVCGLNVDPYLGDPRIGRVRHLYVLAAYRRQGVGRRLVDQVIAAASGVFDTLRLRTGHERAGRFYSAMGFSTCVGQPYCTHIMELASAGVDSSIG